MLPEVRVISQTIALPARKVYEFAHHIPNLPLWAAGLAAGVQQQQGGDWYTDSPMGKVKIAMTPDNPYGVMDHDVTLPNGTTVSNPMRVSPCGDAGSVITFVLVRQPGMSDTAFDSDAVQIQADLRTLKQHLESDKGAQPSHGRSRG